MACAASSAPRNVAAGVSTSGVSMNRRNCGVKTMRAMQHDAPRRRA